MSLDTEMNASLAKFGQLGNNPPHGNETNQGNRSNPGCDQNIEGIMRAFNVCGLGNAIVDIFLEVSNEDFEQLGFERGTMRLVDSEEQQKLFARFHDGRHDLKLVSGGSVANSVIAVSQLGGRAAFIGCGGDDRYGLHYAE